MQPTASSQAQTGAVVAPRPPQTPTDKGLPSYVAYYRVSTVRQGVSGLGLDAQRAAVARHVACHPGKVLSEFTETESGKHARNRPALLAALTLCRKNRATLVIAKLDRLSRNLFFISGLLESGVSFAAADQPTKDRFMLHVQAAFAEEEARRISLRTKEALAAAKRRGVVIGATGRVLAEKHKREALANAEGFRLQFCELAQMGARTTAEFRDGLNERGVSGPGGGRWHLPNTYRVICRLGLRHLLQRRGASTDTPAKSAPGQLACN